jgi:hypothetical protein
MSGVCGEVTKFMCIMGATQAETGYRVLWWLADVFLIQGGIFSVKVY